ncbi:MAG: hypothetical protein IKF64_03660 [Eubacterium sp.]|nr:hypothetical protein [Eubacterium sp.]
MKKFEYKEPEFKVVNTSAEDVLTASNPDTYSFGPWESNMESLGPIVGA